MAKVVFYLNRSLKYCLNKFIGEIIILMTSISGQITSNAAVVPNNFTNCYEKIFYSTKKLYATIFSVNLKSWVVFVRNLVGKCHMSI